MYPLNILFCYVLLLASSSESRKNSTNNDDKRDILTTMRYDSFFVNFTKDQDNKTQFISYNLRENSTKSNDERQYEFRINSTNNDRMDSVRYESHGHIMKIQEENNHTFTKSRANSTKVNIMDNSTLQEFHNSLTKAVGESDFTSYQSYGNFNIDDYNDTIIIISHDACVNRTCIQLCCPFGDRLTSDGTCVAGPAGQDNYTFPDVYQNNSETKKLNELFPVTVYDPCVSQLTAHHILTFDEYSFLVNGYLHQDPGEYPGEFVQSTSYCLAAMERNVYDTAICKISMSFPLYMSVSLLVSLPFLLLTFVVYSLLPEVQNVHNSTVRVQVASLFITNVIIYLVQAFPVLSEWKYCIPMAYIFNFSFMSACFWLNTSCIDIWWTFKKLSLRSVTEKKKKMKKKFVIYSIYAWGITFIVNAVTAIMDAPGIPKNWIRPRMCTKKFWIGGDIASSVYYYGPMGAAYFSNIFLFVATALAILYHNKHTAHQLRDSESRRYDKKKRKFTMYLKLLIVMGLSWTISIILWLVNSTYTVPEILWNISFLINIYQGVIIFILYVCKRKTLRLLLKRFGWQTHGPSLNIISSSNQSTASENTTHIPSVSESVHMQNINLSINQEPNHYAKFNAK